MKTLDPKIIYKLENYFQLHQLQLFRIQIIFFSLENIVLCNISQFQQNYPSLFTGLQFSFHDSSS